MRDRPSLSLKTLSNFMSKYAAIISYYILLSSVYVRSENTSAQACTDVRTSYARTDERTTRKHNAYGPICRKAEA